MAAGRPGHPVAVPTTPAPRTVRGLRCVGGRGPPLDGMDGPALPHRILLDPALLRNRHACSVHHGRLRLGRGAHLGQGATSGRHPGSAGPIDEGPVDPRRRRRVCSGDPGVAVDPRRKRQPVRLPGRVPRGRGADGGRVGVSGQCSEESGGPRPVLAGADLPRHHLLRDVPVVFPRLPGRRRGADPSDRSQSVRHPGRRGHRHRLGLVLPGRAARTAGRPVPLPRNGVGTADADARPSGLVAGDHARSGARHNGRVVGLLRHPGVLGAVVTVAVSLASPGRRGHQAAGRRGLDGTDPRGCPPHHGQRVGRDDRRAGHHRLRRSHRAAHPGTRRGRGPGSPL